MHQNGGGACIHLVQRHNDFRLKSMIKCALHRLAWISLAAKRTGDI